jgi:hypothetical protein
MSHERLVTGNVDGMWVKVNNKIPGRNGYNKWMFCFADK